MINRGSGLIEVFMTSVRHNNVTLIQKDWAFAHRAKQQWRNEPVYNFKLDKTIMYIFKAVFPHII